MRKILLGLGVALLSTLSVQAQDALYMAMAKTQVATAAPTADDQYLVLNLESGLYEGTVNVTGQCDFFFYFRPASGAVSAEKRFGPNVTTFGQTVSFVSYLPFTGTMANNQKCWAASLERGVSSIEVQMFVDVDNMSVVFNPKEPPVPNPAEVYVWASTTGGVGDTYSALATMRPSSDNPDLFEVEWNVPKVGPFTDNANNHNQGYFDQDKYGAGIYFRINTEKNEGGQRFGVPSTVVDADYASKFIQLHNGGVYTQKLAMTASADLCDVVPGKSIYTYNFQTREFTAYKQMVVNFNISSTDDEIADASSLVYIMDSQVSTEDLLQATDGLYTTKFFEMNSLGFYAAEGYSLTVECENPDLTNEEGGDYFLQAITTLNELDDDQPISRWMIHLFPGSAGATFNVVVEKIGTTSVDGVQVEETGAPEYFNLQGVKVANPKGGVYIKVQNGKAVKVVL